MVFSSVVFIFYFLPIFLLGYYVSGWRTGALLLGSVLFYTWGEGAYVLLLLALIALNYLGAIGVGAAAGRRRLLTLAGLVVVDIAVLALFKYAGFALENLNAVTPGAGPLPDLRPRLPLGISFFTFQLVSYLVDVHRGAVKAEHDPIRFAAYILMFPHLIAGPIVRYADIRGELHASRRPRGRTGLGIQYFIVGLCQKVLIANLVAPLADHAFDMDPARLHAAAAWLGLLAYSLQIYFDFCGYSNMAIGLAFMLGFTFPRNFNYPYVSQSMTEFWRRWHISLSSWFRDYVYIPLGGNRHGPARTLRNLLIVFVLTGLWHGAAWQFIVWGLYHGAFLILERFGFAKIIAASPKLARHAYAILAVAGGWVFFRAADLDAALSYFVGLARPAARPDVDLAILLNAQSGAALAAGSLLAVRALPWLRAALRRPRTETPEDFASVGHDTINVPALPIPLLAAGFVICAAVLAGSTLNPFLYFRF